MIPAKEPTPEEKAFREVNRLYRASGLPEISFAEFRSLAERMAIQADARLTGDMVRDAIERLNASARSKDGEVIIIDSLRARSSDRSDELREALKEARNRHERRKAAAENRSRKKIGRRRG